MKDIATLPRELQSYNSSPLQPAGSVGKNGFLNLGFELDSQGRSILRDIERRAPLIVQQGLYFDEQLPDMPCVYILSSGGPNIDGDRYEQHFTVRKDAMAHISTGAATKLAQMRNNHSSVKQYINLESGAYLEYLPEPTIPCSNTRFHSTTNIIIHPTASLCYGEIFSSGRKYYGQGERFKYDLLSVTAMGSRPNGKHLFREKFVVRPDLHNPRTIASMADYDIFANVIVLTKQSLCEQIFQRTKSFINRDNNTAAGITYLPSNCGLLYKVLGQETQPVKRIVREFCSTARMIIKGKPLPEEFPWR